jgi:hypothetical protein
VSFFISEILPSQMQFKDRGESQLTIDRLYVIVMYVICHPNGGHLKGSAMASKLDLQKQNLAAARKRWPMQIDRSSARILKQLTQIYGFSIVLGDLIILDKGWYVTHTGLLRLARRSGCRGIEVEPVQRFSEPSIRQWAFKATVYKSGGCHGFCGYGDADPSNVSPQVRGAEMRVAETRAVNRALRKAYGIGLCSVEELGSLPQGAELNHPPGKVPPQSSNGNGGANGTGNPRVRDRLCQLIRQHQLDPDLVKAYAIDFCGAKTLKDATRTQVENFVNHLADWAVKDRDALLCQLNSYPQEKEKAGEKAGAA